MICMYYVYALVSSFQNRIYVGMTNNPDRRLKEHNLKYVKSTKGYTPWKRFYLIKVTSREQARIWEKKLKSGQGKQYLRSILIENFLSQ